MNRANRARVPSHVIHITGQIGKEDVNAIERTLEWRFPRRYRERREVQVFLDSPGGSFVAGIEIARLLKDFKVPTFVPSGAECLSACAVIFMAGTESLLGGEAYDPRRREIEVPARLGFHRPFIAEFTAEIPPSVIAELGPEELQEIFADEYLAAFDTANDLIKRMLDIEPRAWDIDLLLRMLTATRDSGGEAFVYLETADDALKWDIEVINVVPPPIANRNERFDTAYSLCFNTWRHRIDTGDSADLWPPIDAYGSIRGSLASVDVFSEDGREVRIQWDVEGGSVGCSVLFSKPRLSDSTWSATVSTFGANNAIETFDFSSSPSRLWGHDPRTPLDQLALPTPALQSSEPPCVAHDGQRGADDEACLRQGGIDGGGDEVDRIVRPSDDRRVIPRTSSAVIDLSGAPETVVTRMQDLYGVKSDGGVDERAALSIATALSPRLLGTPERRYDSFRSPLKINWFHHVYAMLPEFVPRSARHVGYYESNQKTEQGSLLAMIATFTDRSATSIGKLWSYLEPHLDALVSKTQWERAKVGDTVQALIEMHNAIAEIPNFEEVLAEYDAESRYVDENLAVEGPYGRQERHRHIYGYLFQKEYGEFIDSINTDINTAWLVSFWARRQHEGNREVVLEILRDVQARYASLPLDQLVPPEPTAAASKGRCLVLEGRRVLDDEPCHREGVTTADGKRVDAFTWPSGSRTILHRKGGLQLLNGKPTQDVKRMPAGMSLCLKSETTGRTFCFGSN